ncbi:hypothetical protein IWX80_002495 [Flavobacterium sp. CAN_S2]|nr:hypothetical protein CLV00_2484 [Flavobacterium sp. 11]
MAKDHRNTSYGLSGNDTCKIKLSPEQIVLIKLIK